MYSTSTVNIFSYITFGQIKSRLRQENSPTLYTNHTVALPPVKIMYVCCGALFGRLYIGIIDPEIRLRTCTRVTVARPVIVAGIGTVGRNVVIVIATRDIKVERFIFMINHRCTSSSSLSSPSTCSNDRGTRQRWLRRSGVSHGLVKKGLTAPCPFKYRGINREPCLSQFWRADIETFPEYVAQHDRRTRVRMIKRFLYEDNMRLRRETGVR